MFFRLVVTALSALSLAASLHAADTEKASYTATVSGVTCSACKAHVEVALKKLPGVDGVTFEKGDKEETVKANFKSSSSTLAKDDVVTALGKDAETYTVVALDKSK
ncbi:heavy-metal-associated domain-containing protein [Roseimicrobium gellanilyticum]|uniref:Heavy-metal-associated domain-containing protein n=1 Tax=Roseimicrobium gellanilyticum TaxID=748857 RepID=A0A366HLR1_9BACT|nr:heavy metal-associated domain-containing protein [Roseimicrobium gellanilyticum]RBP43863.1 heavy-metal-associated domain-containing protein [Roseimicrobium gellanilyticum]